MLYWTFFTPQMSWWSFHPQLLLCKSSLTRTCGRRLENLPRPPRTRKLRKKRVRMRMKVCRSANAHWALQSHCSIWSCDRAFQQVLSSKAKKDNKAITYNKNTKKTNAPLEKLIVQKHWRRQSLVWRCPHNLEALRAKGQILDTKSVQRVVRYHRLTEPRDEEYDQDAEKIGYQQGQRCMVQSCECATCHEPDVIAVAAAQQVYWGSLLVLSLVFVAACLCPQVCLRDCWPTNAPVTDFWMIASTWTHLYATSFWSVF